MNNKLSHIAFRFLRWICPAHLNEEIEGDLIQKFNRDVKTVGEQRAKKKLFWNVIRFFRPGILMRNKWTLHLAPFLLLSNYFKTTYRYALNNKISFGFRLGGLILALFSFLIIAIYITYQLSFDKFHTDYQNIYRLNSTWQEGGQEVRCASVPSSMGSALKAEFPDIKAYSIVSEWANEVILYQDKLFRSGSFIEAESSVFDVFTFQFIAGDKNALVQPGGVVITKSLAKQLFGNDEPIHKLISFPDEYNRTLEVRAVIEDLPPNSSLDVKAIINFGALRDGGDGELYSWNLGYGGNLFVKFNEHVDVNQFEKKIKPLLTKNLSKTFDGHENTFMVFLQPLSDIYMGEPLRWEFDRKGNAVYLYVYVSLAIFLLVIASVNYINLSIADFSFRNKEIGVRKVLGARKKQIVFQITIETILHCLFALLVSTGILYLVFPKISAGLDFNLNFQMLYNPEVFTWVLIAFSLLVLTSVAYPAYCLALNNPIHDLKRIQIVGRKLSINNVLLLVQFLISGVCLSSTWVVRNQLQYIKAKDIGFDRNNLLEVFLPYRFPLEKAPILKNEINRIAGVVSTSYSYYHITGIPYFNAWYKVEMGNEMKQVMLNEVFADEDFIRTMKLNLVQGRNFENKNEFRSAFIVNESALKEFGWNEAIGKKIAVGNEQEQGGIWSEGTVVGVVRDFNTRSLHKKIEPVVLRLQYDEWPGNHLNVRYRGSEKEVIASIKKVYEKVMPGFLINYSRVSDQYERQYTAENQAFSTLQLATWVILLISSIGIFSMSMFMSFKRQKEFGIRKVVGASAVQITSLHISHFLKTALIANVISLPIAYYLMGLWLNEFAFRTEISVITFFLFRLCVTPGCSIVCCVLGY